MSERYAVVTGASGGIGRAIAEGLGARGYHVTIVARDAARCARVAESVVASGGAAEVITDDLGDPAGVRRVAARLAERPRIDRLVHDAGLWPNRLERNSDGLERAYAVNHVAPFLLDRALEPVLFRSRARVILVSAGLYVMGRVDLVKTPRGDDFHPIRTYATTKLCALMMVPLFAERWRDHGAEIVAVHPGVIRTALGDRPGAAGFALRTIKRLWKSPEEGARPVLALADAASVPSGAYYHVSTAAPRPLAAVATNAALARALYDRTDASCRA